MFETIGHFKILEKLGAGSIGDVFRARDTRLGRTVAIVVVPAAIAGDPRRRERFLRDAHAAAGLSHPNIAALYEIGEDQDQLFLVCEYVPGQSLKAAIGGRPMNTRRAIDLAVQVADALADAHAAGIVHRDIQPETIVVTPKGNAKIGDAGLASWTSSGQERERAATRTSGGSAATIAYMSPEQAVGEAFDQRTDIFSLGAVLYEMLTGRPPFTGATEPALLLQVIEGSRPGASTVNAKLPPEVDALIAKMIAKDPAERFESAATIAAELRTLAAILEVRSDVSDAEVEAAFAAINPPRRSFSGWIVALVIVAAATAGAWFERGAIERLWRRSIGPAPAPVIAVMGAGSAAPDGADTQFADQLLDDLSARLGQTPGLTVVGRSSARDARGKAPKDVVHDAGAAVALTGGVSRDGDAVSLTLSLVEPVDGATIWSNHYARDVKDLFALQAQAAADVVQALKAKSQATPSAARAASRLVDPRAYDLYVRARAASARRRPADAIPLYEQAAAADPGLGEAFAGLADALQAELDTDPRADIAALRARLKEAAKRALEVDQDLPQANVAMALAADTRSPALGYLRHALELDPSYADAWRRIGDQLQDIDPERAIEIYQTSLGLDPHLEASRAGAAAAMLTLDRPDAAAQEMSALPRESPFAVRGPFLRPFVDVEHRQFDKALVAMRDSPATKRAPALWARYVAALRMAGRAQDAMAEATLFMGRSPALCQPRALLAGLRHDRHADALARQLADPLLAAARDESASPWAMRCAVLTAAAMDDAAGTAALLDRIAGKPEWLYWWTLDADGDVSSSNLRGRWYPWSNVTEKPPVVAARQRMAGAYEKQRETARAALSGL